jgi:CheY-like chemotaxis protein
MKTINCILLIDDNVDDNFFHTRAITKVNAAKQIKTVTTGEKALEYIELCKLDPDQYPVPDLIFLDINMPGMNGFEFLEKVREKKIVANGKPVLIVMLTSSLNPNDEKMAVEKFSNEIKAFKNKPLTVEMLKEIIDNNF